MSELKQKSAIVLELQSETSDIYECHLLQNTEAKQSEAGSAESWPHLKLEFLKPNKIRDAKRRTPADPDYDPKTLHVPEEFKRNLTPVSNRIIMVMHNSH
jgi:hypothetical protein